MPSDVSPEDLKLELDYKDKQLIKQLEKEHELKLAREQKLKQVENESSLKDDNKKEELTTVAKNIQEEANDRIKEYKEEDLNKPQPVAHKYKPNLQKVCVV